MTRRAILFLAALMAWGVLVSAPELLRLAVWGDCAPPSGDLVLVRWEGRR